MNILNISDILNILQPVRLHFARASLTYCKVGHLIGSTHTECVKLPPK